MIEIIPLFLFIQRSPVMKMTVDVNVNFLLRTTMFSIVSVPLRTPINLGAMTMGSGSYHHHMGIALNVIKVFMKRFLKNFIHISRISFGISPS